MECLDGSEGDGVGRSVVAGESARCREEWVERDEQTKSDCCRIQKGMGGEDD